MKKNIILTLILVVALLTAAGIVALSRSKLQGASGNSKISSSVIWNKQATDVSLDNNQLHVIFDESFSDTNWRVGVHVADVEKAKLTVALLSLKQNGDKPFLRQMEKVVNWPEKRLQNEAGRIEYLGRPESDDIVVHIILPLKAQLSIQAGPKTLFLSPISHDILIDKKGVSEKSMANMASLMAISLVSTKIDLPAVTFTKDGNKLVSLENLRQHLQSSKRPRFPAEVLITQPEDVIIRAVINGQGQIVDTKVIKGTEVFASSALSALVSWKFKPFVINDMATDVVGVFVFSFDTNGTVLVPILGDGYL